MSSLPSALPPLSVVGDTKARFSSEGEAMESFEAVFLSQMVDEMMKTVNIDATMGAHSAEMWRSVLSKSLADSLVENGGLGIAQSIQSKLDAYKDHMGGDDA